MANLNIEQKTVKELFQGSKHTFLIPDYQRPYAWGETECKRLWDDLFAFAIPEGNCDKFKENEEYFLGCIVTFKNEDKMEVIDGQQRLTTLMLLLRAFYNKLGNMKDPSSISMKENIGKCIWCTDQFGIVMETELKIDSQVASDEDKEEFISILKDGKTDGKKSRYAGNFNYFVNEIAHFLDDYPTYFPYLPARILNNCVLLPIEAESQDTALRIFSTLNDRGKPLSDADIFKAQLYKFYSSQGKNKKDYFIDTWKVLERITNDIFHPTTGTPLDELFTRYMYFLRAQRGNKSTTTGALRKFYEDDGTYPTLHDDKTLDNLVKLVLFWQDVQNQNDERFSEDVLKRLFILNYAPNGMWTYIVSVYFMYHDMENDWNDKAFCDFLNLITAFIFAYAITNPGVNSLRTPIYAEMLNIVYGNEVTFSNFKFTKDVLHKQIAAHIFANTRAITKSILTWWAFHWEGQQLPPLETRFDIEHIFARNRNEKTNELENKDSIELLGNKALLEKRINIRASDYKFKDKIPYYQGFTPATGKKKEGTQIVELLELGKSYTDFTEKDIVKRNEQIIDGFISFLNKNNLIE